MIRRDVQLADGSPGWALISQIEHARISAQLASHCRGRFGAASASLIRDEVLIAIAAHDDGWREWEESPQLDEKHGRPLSFMELAVGDATAIWAKSIVIAEEIGPLAAWMVSGHFQRLLEHSEHARLEPLAKQWLAAIRPQREAWFAKWQAIEPELRNAAVAEEALQWLWTFDEASLWFCCSCPTVDVAPTASPARGVGEGTPIEMRLSCLAHSSPAGESSHATAEPWQFSTRALEFEASALVVPQRRYSSADELFAIAEPTTLRWRFLAGSAD